ncbi:S41 family peptidase [Deinococcus sonorensis]|uniref:S41 family peptidase n=2 Tax=Deinococcus sonorensis TaxID=309891 RepID=A0AAU7U7L9_9DEIO
MKARFRVLLCGCMVPFLSGAGAQALPPAVPVCPPRQVQAASGALPSVAQRIEILAQVTRTLQEQYVDPAAVDQRWLTSIEPLRQAALAAADDRQFEQAMTALLATLHDRHTAWFSPAATQLLRDVTAGTLRDPLGMWFLALPGHLPSVDWVEPHSPAEQAGVRQGDVLLSINGQVCPRSAALDGPAGTRVTLGLQGPHGPARQVTVTRGQLTDTVPWQVTRLKGHPWVYLRLDSFLEEGIATEVRRQLDAVVRAGGVQGVIVDLRANTGGWLGEGQVLMGAWTDQTFMTEVGRTGDRLDVPGFPYAYEGALGVLPEQMKVAVLVGPNTASMAEMTAAALRVVRHAAVLGQPTADVQGTTAQQALPNGAVFQWSRKRVMLPDHRLLGRGPIQPDVLLPLAPMQPPEDDPAVAAALRVLSASR